MKNPFLRRLFGLAALVTLCGTLRFAQQATVHFNPVERAVVERRLRTASMNNGKRERTLKAMFQEAGCRDTNLTEQPVKHEDVSNLKCSLPGLSDALIIVGAHTDAAPGGKGVVDNWSGAALLPSLYESVREQPRRHTFLFIGLAAAKSGGLGSKFYVLQLGAERMAKIRAMVNLDDLGLGPTKVESHGADPKLLQDLTNVAAALRSPLAPVELDQVATDDSDSFRAAKIPTISIHSLTQKTLHIIIKADDSFSDIKWNDYYESYRLVAAYLGYLDGVLD